MLKRFLKSRLLLSFTIFFVTFILFYTFSSISVYSAPNSVIYTYDMSSYYVNYKSSEVYDEALFVSTLQGIVNKKGPRFYVFHDYYPVMQNENIWNTINIDKNIFNELRKPGQWLDGYTIVALNTIDDVITQFSSDFSEIVVWDPRVDATVNVATTAAGIENTPVVMYGGKMHSKLTASPYNKGISRNFNGQFSGANAKTDAYYWAKATFLDNALSDRCKIMSIASDGYSRIPDGVSLNKYVSCRDYIVKNGAFVFDLSPWDDEKPNDSPEQTLGADYNCFTSIMQTAKNKWGNNWPIEIIGFTPWWNKYTAFDGKSSHGMVETEWREAQLLSSYNSTMTQIIDNFGSSNASFHSWAPYPVKMAPQEAPTKKTLENKTYICYFNGDHDGGTLNYCFNKAWLDPRRGQIPIGWGIACGLIRDYPSIYSYLRDTATQNDYFWAGSSGAGYSNPSEMDAGVWKKFNEYYYNRSGFTMTGFILNGNAGIITDSVERMYRDFSGDGIAGHSEQTHNPDFDVRNGNVAVATIQSDIDRADADAIASQINSITSGLTNPGKQPNFVLVRSSFALPSALEASYKKLISQYPQYNYEVVDPYTFFSLVRQKTLGQKTHDAVIIGVEALENMVANEKYDVKVSLRNVGNNTWTRNDGYGYRLAAGSSAAETENNQFTWSDWQDGGLSNSLIDQRAFLSASESITPQETKTFSFKITAPSTAGAYDLTFRMVHDGVCYFGSSYKKTIQVNAATQREAKLISVTAPSEIIEGQTATVSFTYKNIGTSTWTNTNAYKLGALMQNAENQAAIPNMFEWSNFANGGFSNGVEDQRAYLGSSERIAPGQEKTFTFNVTAPYGRGKYVLSGRMVRDGYGWFGDNAVKEITVVPASRSTNDAKIVQITVPEYVAPGEKVNASISIRNTGTSTWVKSQNFRLGTLTDNNLVFTDMRHGGFTNSINDQRVFLSNQDTIKPEETKTFSFSFTAPASTGTYNLSVRMVKELVAWFGDSITVPIRVHEELDSQIGMNDVPSQLAAGSESTFTISIKNIGTDTWKRDTWHRFASTSNNEFQLIIKPEDGFSNNITDQRVFLPTWSNIMQNEEIGLPITVKTPDTPGTYTLEFRMVKEGVAWFGQTFSKTIQVVNGYERYVNVGGTAITDENGYQWLADRAYTANSWGYTGTTTTSSATSISIGDFYPKYGPSVYKDLRKGTSFGYRFDNVPNGEYRITLLFADILSTASGQNLTSIDIEDYDVITGLDVYKNRCGSNKALYTTNFHINVTDGTLNIDLSSLSGYAFLNGLIVQRVQ